MLTRCFLFILPFLFPACLSGQLFRNDVTIVDIRLSAWNNSAYTTGVFELGKKFGKGYLEGKEKRLLPKRNRYAGIGAEFSFSRPFILGPKVTFEYNKWLLALRGEFTWFTDFNRSDPRPALGAGISWFGWIGLYYIYQVPVVSSPIDGIARHKIEFAIRFPAKWF